MDPKTPRFFTRLFKWFCNGDFFEELQGDLEEKFFENIEALGARKARNIYRKEVWLMIRPSVVKRPQFITNLLQMAVFRIHLKLTMRNLVRNKVFSAVNIFGLAAALSICLFLVNLLYTGYNLDRQHPHTDRLYRIVTKIKTNEGYLWNYAGSPTALKAKLKADFPQFELVTALDSTTFWKFPINEDFVSAYGYKTDPTLFKLFNFEVLKGDPWAIFDDPNSIIITADLAQKLYPEEDPLGQLTQSGQEVVAVIESPKHKSHLYFQVLAGEKPHTERDLLTSMINGTADYPSAYTYVRLANNTAPEEAQAALSRLSVTLNEHEKSAGQQIALQLQHVHDINYKSYYALDFEFVFDASFANQMLVIVVLIIAMAAFNYTNLSIARALQRTKEIGIRKIVGSSSGQIRNQFLIETLCFSLLALLLALALYYYFSPLFPVAMEELDGLFTPGINPSILFVFVLFTLSVGVLAGLLPALYFGKVNPLRVINDKIKSRTLSLIRLRRLITALQLTVSLFAAFFISVVYDQYNQLLSADLGFEREQLITFKRKATDAALLMAELEKIPEVEQLAVTSFIPGASGMSVERITGTSPSDTVFSYYGLAGPGFYDTYKVRFVKGTSFSEDLNPALPEVIVNPTLLAFTGIPLDSAIGSIIQHLPEPDSLVKLQIVGVMDGFTRNALDYYESPIMLQNSNQLDAMVQFTIRLNEEEFKTGLSRVETAWEKLNADQQFTPLFVDDTIEESYQFFHGIIKSFSFMGLMVVLISILGQLGMALYNAETRVKEIGIRKVLGAPVTQIIRQLIKGTLITVALASLIAGPAAYLLTRDFFPVSGITLEVSSLAMVRGITLFVVLVSAVIISQTWRIANQNPARSLRNE